jgi:DNA (cytosine-5)-methyltransferase 1
MNAIDLFSGIGGFSLGLAGYTRTVLYCEADPHAQAVLLSRMAEGKIDCAPICTDVREITSGFIDVPIDIICGGFPCQDISVAGKGVGLEGERSGLFFEIVRLAKEIKPKFLFLENVAAIRTRGLDRVIQELTEVGYDCRWTMLSAADVGAPHKRERWFLLAHSKSNDGRRRLSDIFGEDAEKQRSQNEYQDTTGQLGNSSNHTEILANTDERGLSSSGAEQCSAGTSRSGASTEHGTTESRLGGMADGVSPSLEQGLPDYLTSDYWQEEPEGIPRVTKEKEQRVECIKRLGNAVVPLQVRAAFECLMGIKERL